MEASRPGGGTCLKEQGPFLEHLNSAAPESLKTAGSAAESLGAQSQKKMQEVISKIPRTAAYETFPGVTNFSALCPPMSPSTPIPVALASHTLKKMTAEEREKGRGWEER